MSNLNFEFFENDGPIHAWTGSKNRVMVSIERCNLVYSFRSMDEAINHLYCTGFKSTARALHKHQG